jgi:hypothetical protein
MGCYGRAVAPVELRAEQKDRGKPSSYPLNVADFFLGQSTIEGAVLAITEPFLDDLVVLLSHKIRDRVFSIADNRKM